MAVLTALRQDNGTGGRTVALTLCTDGSWCCGNNNQPCCSASMGFKLSSTLVQIGSNSTSNSTCNSTGSSTLDDFKRHANPTTVGVAVGVAVGVSLGVIAIAGTIAGFWFGQKRGMKRGMAIDGGGGTGGAIGVPIWETNQGKYQTVEPAPYQGIQEVPGNQVAELGNEEGRR